MMNFAHSSPYHTFLLSFCIVCLLCGCKNNTEAPTHIATKYQVQQIIQLPLPDQVQFANENIDLSRFDLVERLEREMLVNTYWHSNTLLMIKRANRYFPMLDSLLDAEKVPRDFKFLTVAESGLSNAVSSSGAVGFWQIMQATGTEMGLEINDEVDDRYHIVKSTKVACAYLRKAKTQFGSWTMAAAAYNMGYSGLAGQIENQKQNNYYELLLNEETSRYVFRIAALKVIITDPQKYGFDIPPTGLYSPLSTSPVKVTGPVPNMADFASAHGTTYKYLKLANPWLRKPYLTNKLSKEYTIEILENTESKK